MKKTLVLVMAVVLISLLSISCSSGVSQDKYDKVNSDLAAAQAQIQTLQTQLSAKQSEFDASSAKIVKAKADIDVLNAIFIPAMSGEFNNMTEAQIMNLFIGWRDKVNAIGDTALTAKFQAIIDSNGGQQETMDFFMALLQDTSKSLE
jgi:outer membrane murein-binding lipoprotein Lpp